MQGHLWTACAVAVVIAAVAAFADRRRMRRDNLDRVGFMPWAMIMVLALVSAAVFAAFALKIHA